MITEHNFLFSISTIRKKAFSFLQKEMTGIGVHDIPPSYGDVLYAIKANGCTSIKDICKDCRKDKSTVSLIVDALVKTGYVTKTKKRNDSRSIELQPTAKADSITKDMLDISVKLSQKLFTNMTMEEKSILFLLLGKLGKNL